jgi:hypothetical protein
LKGGGNTPIFAMCHACQILARHFQLQPFKISKGEDCEAEISPPTLKRDIITKEVNKHIDNLIQYLAISAW